MVDGVSHDVLRVVVSRFTTKLFTTTPHTYYRTIPTWPLREGVEIFELTIESVSNICIGANRILVWRSYMSKHHSL